MVGVVVGVVVGVGVGVGVVVGVAVGVAVAVVVAVVVGVGVVVKDHEKKTLATLAVKPLEAGRYEFRVRFGQYSETQNRILLALYPTNRIEGTKRIGLKGDEYETVFATFNLRMAYFINELKRLATEAKIPQDLPLADFADAFRELRVVGEVFIKREPYRDVRGLKVIS